MISSDFSHYHGYCLECSALLYDFPHPTDIRVDCWVDTTEHNTFESRENEKLKINSNSSCFQYINHNTVFRLRQPGAPHLWALKNIFSFIIKQRLFAPSTSHSNACCKYFDVFSPFFLPPHLHNTQIPHYMSHTNTIKLIFSPILSFFGKFI